jgi:hypothetical protein
MKTIIFGDIHACYEEWSDLLSKIGPSSDDQLVCVGDLVCKGPSTKKTLDLALSLKNLRCVMGNHELYILNRWLNDDLANLIKDYQHNAVDEMGSELDRYMKYISKWPLYLDLKECIVVHAGLRPGIPLKKQKQEDLVHLRTVEPDDKPWYELYKNKKLVVHGHWAKKGLIVRDNVIGLDTGCVYGKELSAVILPERKIVSVRARKAYQPI